MKMIPVENIRTIYPRLPDIPDEETLNCITVFETKEQTFFKEGKDLRKQYLRALYLKAMSYLGHSRFLPGNLPRLMRIKIAEVVGAPKEFVNIFRIKPDEKSRIVADVRQFIGLFAYRRKERLKLEKYLYNGIAQEIGELPLIINAAIQWFRDNSIEIPEIRLIITISEKSLTKADDLIKKKILKGVDDKKISKIERLLLVKRDNKVTLFDWLKQDARESSSVTIQTELKRIEEIQQLNLYDISIIKEVSRFKVEHFAEIGSRYTASELRQMNLSSKISILSCYLKIRYSQLLDVAANMFIQVWKKANVKAKIHSNERQEKVHKINEQNNEILKQLLDFICDSDSKDELFRQVHMFMTKEEYEHFRNQLKNRFNWTECFYEKLHDHYSALRCFLPDWYNIIPLVSTIAEDSLIKGINFIKQHGNPKNTLLPVVGVPTEFLSAEWERRAITRHLWNKRITSVNKSFYELGTVDATTSSFENGTIAIEGAGRYSSMNEHLLDREEFLRNYQYHFKRLNLPEKAKDFYDPIKKQTSEILKEFNDGYDEYKKVCKVNKKGTLSYLMQQPVGKTPGRIKNLINVLQPYIRKATVFDVLLDCQNLTGFLDAFQPLTGRQNMSEIERILSTVSTLYAYATNTGPTQTEQATGITKQKIVYTRRHYMGLKQLMEAASILVDAYTRTEYSKILKDPGIFMTDSMRFPTLEDSIIAEEHYRYPGGKHVLLYQHVTPDFICFFTNATLCDASEGIYMIHGITKQQTGLSNFSKNICDNAGRSDLTDGMAIMIKIEVWSRLSSRQNLKLWRVDDTIYTNIEKAFSGTIQFEFMDKGWLDMARFIASIESKQGDPSLLADMLRSQTNHPANKGFVELGKLCRTGYMIRYGIDMNIRRPVMRYTALRETYNQFGRDIHQGFRGIVQEKNLTDQNELFWFLTVLQNAITLWNALAFEEAISKARSDGVKIEDNDLKHILPTKIEHINFVGTFDINLDRDIPFKLAA